MEVVIVENKKAKAAHQQYISTPDMESNGSSLVLTTMFYEYPIYRVNNRMCVLESLRCVTQKPSGPLDLSVSTSTSVGGPVRVYNEKYKDIIVTYDNFNEDTDLEIMLDFVNFFGIRVEENDENATILVVRLSQIGFLSRSEKAGNALVANRPIVTLQWLLECMTSKSLLPVHHYMPVDHSQELSPLASWRFGRGITYSRYEWTNHCTLFFHTSVKRNKIYSFIKSWAQTLGFVIIDDFKHFKQDGSHMNIILLEDCELEEGCSGLPNINELFAWMYDYKALSVNVSWFLECVFQYKYIEIAQNFLPIVIPLSIAVNTGVIAYYKINKKHKI